MKNRSVNILFVLIVLSIFVTTCKQNEKEAEAMSGKELSEVYCTSCHMYPEPGLLNKATWKNHVLVRMGAFMGIYNDNVQYFDELPDGWKEPGYGGIRVANANIYPQKPIITREEWESIRDFYLSNAPEILPGNKAAQIVGELTGFNQRALLQNTSINPHITALKISGNHILVGIYNKGILRINSKGVITDSVLVPGMIVDINESSDGFFVTDIGSRFGRDLPMGILYMSDNFTQFSEQLLKFHWDSLQRPVHVNTADLDNDGDFDLVLCEYGNLLGQLCWHENVGGGLFQKHILHADDGAIKTEVLDIDGNGYLDIVVLIGNSDEGIDVYYNRDGKNFERKRVLRFLPTNGSTSFQLTDWDKDGDMDILYTEGDNGDYVPVLKPHHGIRLYLNSGNFEFSEYLHLPMNGVYKAIAEDFDMDGDNDIAAISFQPDFNNGSHEGFIFFRNTGNDKFEKFSIPQVAEGRWMCLESGDIDGDGDVDILLGAFDIKTPEVSDVVARQWESASLPVLLLENMKY